MTKFEHYDQGTPSWIELMTPDQGAAQTFYGGLFGWSYDDHDMCDMGHYYIPKFDGDEIGGISGQMPGMEGHPAFWGVYLAVDDVDATTAKVEPAGGKVEAGETPEECLIRELKEELGIDVVQACLAPFVFASHAYEDFHLMMPLYLLRRWSGLVEG